MKEQRNKKNLTDGSDVDVPDSKTYDYSDLILEEMEEDNFYGLLGEDQINFLVKNHRIL